MIFIDNNINRALNRVDFFAKSFLKAYWALSDKKNCPCLFQFLCISLFYEFLMYSIVFNSYVFYCFRTSDT